MKDVRTWIEIDATALRHNAEQFLRLLPEGTRFMAVVKSNAYGHGLSLVAKALSGISLGNGVSKWKPRFQTILWFGVDSIVEALRLRREGIKNPILVLGFSLRSRIPEAGARGIALTVSNFEALKAMGALKRRPSLHLKIDTGMHRQGFFSADAPEVIRLLKRFKIRPQGIYTHFASAKDPDDRQYTEMQLSVFGGVSSELERAGFRGMIRHAAASGGVLIFSESHLDMVRVGMGLYGYWPSEEIKNKISKSKNAIRLEPVLIWKTIVSEVKNIPRGARVGYDGTERVKRPTRMAVLPVGYWHGIDRGLSGKGEVLIRGRRAKMLGRVSMDMTVVDVSDTPGVRQGDEAVLIGRQGGEKIGADTIGEKIDTTAYEVLTLINPLIRRVASHDK